MAPSTVYSTALPEGSYTKMDQVLRNEVTKKMLPMIENVRVYILMCC